MLAGGLGARAVSDGRPGCPGMTVTASADHLIGHIAGTSLVPSLG